MELKYFLIKVHYFCFNAGQFAIFKLLIQIINVFHNYLGISPTTLFIPVIAKQLGFSPLIVGLLLSIYPIACTVTKPLLSALADK